MGLRKSTEPAELLCLTIEAKRKRYGGEIHLSVPPQPTRAGPTSQTCIDKGGCARKGLGERFLSARRPYGLDYELVKWENTATRWHFFVHCPFVFLQLVKPSWLPAFILRLYVIAAARDATGELTVSDGLSRKSSAWEELCRIRESWHLVPRCWGYNCTRPVDTPYRSYGKLICDPLAGQSLLSIYLGNRGTAC